MRMVIRHHKGPLPSSTGQYVARSKASRRLLYIVYAKSNGNSNGKDTTRTPEGTHASSLPLGQQFSSITDV